MARMKYTRQPSPNWNSQNGPRQSRKSLVPFGGIQLQIALRIDREGLGANPQAPSILNKLLEIRSCAERALASNASHPTLCSSLCLAPDNLHIASRRVWRR